jgi:hypothetical protein
LLGQFTHQCHRDHAFARPGAARDDHRFLRVRLLGALHRTKHRLEGDLLVIEQRELRITGDRLPRMLQELPGRSDLGVEEIVGELRPCYRGQARGEESPECGHLVGGENGKRT